MVDRPVGLTGDAGGIATPLGAIHQLGREGHAMSLSTGHKMTLISTLIQHGYASAPCGTLMTSIQLGKRSCE
jgi:hypothetical protein